MELAKQSCIPCQGGIPPLSNEEIAALRKELTGHWQISAAGHLEAQYPFTDFKHALRFANRIGELAEQEGHHPDLTIAWGMCKIELWTHKINGLTHSDFVLAAKIDQL